MWLEARTRLPWNAEDTLLRHEAQCATIPMQKESAFLKPQKHNLEDLEILGSLQ